MKRKSLIWSLVILFTIISGCSGGGTQKTGGDTGEKAGTSGNEFPKEAVELSFWYGWTGPEAEALEKLIAKWNAANPDIKVKGLSQSDYQKQLTAITGGNPPDIASQFGQDVVPWGLRGAMMPLDDFIAKDGVDLKDFVPAALSTSQHEGKTYAIPTAMHVTMLFYNKDILKEAGYDGPPETISELKEYIKKLSIVEGEGRLQRLGLWPGMDTYTFSYAFNGSFYDEAAKQVTPDHEGVKSAIKLSKEIWDQYGSENLDRFSSGLGQYMSAQNPFFSGKYAMTIDGEWLPTFIKQFAPNLNYGIAPIPYDENNPDLKNSGNVTTSVFYIPKGVKNPDASWKFLKWITEAEQMAEFTAAIGNLPTRTSAFSNPLYADVPGFKEFLDYSESKNLKSFPATSFSNEYMTEFTAQYDAILRGKASIEEGLNKVKEKIQPLVK
ncbi:carbohydrate ABC transporter substrate-binding protein, CUT1 family (TC 3.A.1.1.-) [Paenibacillus uliginis N3/975]|uniref:Carbohydrate ABC transporter substrate-binding protein, CUT1 family (TC 3.A.1.1.-) n=1 Tax=Paenibacillus uliginis N3/975 TaxID=1313296 RepID=A0A1X7H209_9BACL|nr:ABC transporter substrate-binding protein [Paenibacillus uliginis]SMF78219.1 carbohydrate ABC transporter substrate-binding protein, CUT1 family (TC 3.A.1.1.-) [Paenibacillus uliginis N3/975]